MARPASTLWAARIVACLPLAASIAGAQPALRLDIPVTPDSIVGGAAVAALGNDVLVAAPASNGSPNSNEAVHLFDGTTGAFIRTYSTPASGFTFFGFSIAVVGNDVVVGAMFDSSGAPSSGVVHLFDGATGALLRTFPNPTPADGDDFGYSVASVGGNVLVGAPFDDTGAGNAGSVYLFDTATGTLLRTFPNPAPTVNAQFGLSVAALAGNVLVGAPGVDRVYLLDSGTGVVLQTFVAPNGGAFGRAVTAVGGNALIGAPFDITMGTAVGAAYLFDGATGVLLHTFSNPAPAGGGLFGSSVAGAGGHALVGSILDDTGATDTGAAYVFDTTSGALVRTLLNPTPASSDGFGSAVGGLGNGFVVSAPGDATITTNDGAAYLFCGGAAGCGPCETCGPLGTCVVAPNPTCRSLGADGRSRLRLNDNPNDAGDRVGWSWRGHGVVDVQDWGHPLTSSDYTLCLYDASDALVFRATAPADGTCGTRPCWRPVSTSGFRYLDGDRTPDGVQKIVVRAVQRDGGHEMLNFKANGALLTGRAFGLPALPPGLPLRAQMQARDGWCWEATYSAATTATSRRFIAASD
jgi:hypothetical protein